MKCPICAHINPPNVKFCNDCGQMMGTACPGCNTVNLPEAKFCGQCGKVLATKTSSFSIDEPFRAKHPELARSSFPQTDAGERKHVTVLFSDVSGYTTLTQRLDPEEVRDVMARLFHEITNVVARYEGFIEKFAGDAAMAVFGAVRAHEDDAIRAIITAREIHESVEALSHQYEKQIGQKLTMHTGVNTGLVVTGDEDFDKGTHGIAGAPLNIAARLCSLAKPGEILVGTETYRHALGYFNFTSLDPVDVKGVSEPIQVYKVISLIDLPKKIHRFSGLRAELIGRNPELEILANALGRVRAGQGRLVSICGNAGTGKSRLVEEFKYVLNHEKVNWREGQCYPYSRNFPYFPLIDLLNRTLGIYEGDPRELVREKIETGLKFFEHSEEVVPYVGSLYNFKYPQLEKINPETWRLRLQRAFLEILIKMARRAPTIFCLEDLHWADPSSLELIRFLLSDFRYPALVLCVYRPSLTLLSNQQIANLGKSYSEIRLEDLSPAETEAMLGSLLKTEQLPLELKRFVREKAGGNPFYLEEIINSLVESENLIPDKNLWVLRKKIWDLKISSTVHGVIAARIDRLETEMKGVLQEAAVIGRSFSHDILSRITALKNNIWHHLSSLETLDIIKVRSYRPSVEYVFKHALTQEVVYSGLVKNKRIQIHDRIGHVIEHLYPDRISEYYETLAYHFQRGESHKKAVEYLAKSGEKSLARYALEEAHQYYQDAYDSINEHIDGPDRENLKIRLLNKWAFVYYYRGRYKELLKLLNDHKKTLETLQHNQDRAMFHAWLGWALWHREQFQEAHQNLLSALSLAAENKDGTVIGYVCCWLTWVCTELGIPDDAIMYAERAQNIYHSANTDDYIYFSSMAGRGYALWHKGEKGQTLEAGKALLDFGREHGDYRSKGMGHCCIGWSALIGGELSEATKCFEKAVQISVDPWYSMFPKLALAYGLILNGRVDDAGQYIDEIEKFSQEYGVEFAGGPARFFKGVSLVGKGHIDQGLRILEKSCQQCLQTGSKLRFAAFGTMLAAVYSELTRKARAEKQGSLAQQVCKKAVDYYQSSIETAKEIGANRTLAQAYRSWGNFYKNEGNIDKAKNCFSEAAAYFRLCGAEALLKQVEEGEQNTLTKDHVRNSRKG